MKYAAVILSVFLSFGAGAQTIKNYVRDSVPKSVPPRLVNDFADVLTPDQESQLESKLVAYNDSTTSQIAVVTKHTINELPVE